MKARPLLLAALVATGLTPSAGTAQRFLNINPEWSPTWVGSPMGPRMRTHRPGVLS